MKKVLIVDDDTTVRITLHSLICWEDLGFQIAADAIHGQQALDYLEKADADLIITDMKMPVLDGIGFLRELGKKGSLPVVLVLSSYDEFHLVREAFRLGAYDYLLKVDLTGEALTAMLKRIKTEVFKEREERRAEAGEEFSRSKLLSDMAMGKQAPADSLLAGEYLVLQLEIQEFYKVSARFGEDFEEELIKPFIRLAGQIPRVASRCVLGALSPSRYVMLYQIADPLQYQENAVSACRQLLSVWKNFMNLSVAAGISRKGKGAEDFFACFEEAGEQLKLTCLKGRGMVCYSWEENTVSCKQVQRAMELYGRLIDGLLEGDELLAAEEKKQFLTDLYEAGLCGAKRLCLYLICALAWKLKDNQDDIHALFAEEINYYEKVERLKEMRSLELWLNNYFRWILDYRAHLADRRQADMMLRAKRFILDNYANPELTLGSVAGFVGLNEKYFSSRFTAREGMTFISYLTQVRIRKARELMETTDMKIYEISQSVGYNSVEHFTRVFKKVYKVSPGSLRK